MARKEVFLKKNYTCKAVVYDVNIRPLSQRVRYFSYDSLKSQTWFATFMYVVLKIANDPFNVLLNPCLLLDTTQNKYRIHLQISK